MKCRICGHDAGGGSMGGRDVCALCDCYPPNESKLIRTIWGLEQRVRELEAELEAKQ